MEKAKRLLAYCGLYCGDCAGYSGEISEKANGLKKMLGKYKFELTASCLFSKELKDYDKFVEMLEFLTGLKCERICREREDTEKSCNIRKCCRDKGFYSCHECSDFETCEKLRQLEGLHGDSCVENLRALKEKGLEDWVAGGKRLWFGSDVDS